jgi:hypothetical protein
MMPDDPEDAMPVVILSDRQAAAFAAYQAGVRDAQAGIPALVDPWHLAHRWAWLDGWQDGHRKQATPCG